MATRTTRNQPFCWQEKSILRMLRKEFQGAELVKLRNLYLTLTEIHSDFNGKPIKFFTKTISTYSGLSKEWIPKGLSILESFDIISFRQLREGGEFVGKELIFTPERAKIPSKTVPGKAVNGQAVNGDSPHKKIINLLEDSTVLEDSMYKDKIVETDVSTSPADKSTEKPTGEDSLAYRGVMYAIAKIEKNFPRLSKSLNNKNAVKRYVTVFERLLKHYKREEIKKAIDFATDDDFWKYQFQAPSKLWKKDRDGIRYIDKFLIEANKTESIQPKRINPDDTWTPEYLRYQRQR